MIITSIVTGSAALKEFKLQLFTFEQWHKDALPTFYIYTDDETEPQIQSIQYGGKIFTKQVLNRYKGLARNEMETKKGIIFPSIWSDLMCEKISCIRWAFKQEGEGCKGVFFMDGDITLLGRMPTIPEGVDVALSPHYIRKTDSDKYGYYNGGFGWLANPSFCDIWEEATMTSRFFEQAALEEVAKAAKNLYIFPIQYNFGWWRMFQQAEQTPDVVVKRFGFHRSPESCGITFDGEPIGSIHSHFTNRIEHHNREFNGVIISKLSLLRSHKPANELLQYLRKNF